MRGVSLLLLLGCASAPAPAPAASSPEGSHAELLRPVGAPASIAELDEAIGRLKDLASRSSEPGPLLLRLADALHERATAHGRAEALTMEEAFEQRRDSEARERAEAEGEVHAAARLRDLSRARQVLEAIEPSSPHYAAARRTRFWLLAERRDWEADSLAAARDIIDGGSEGELRAAAQLRLAEAAFADARFDDALTHYAAVLATAGAEPQTRAFASYKRAWVLFDLDRFTEADGAFAECIAIAHDESADQTLVREAAKDRLRVHVSLQSPPERVLGVIAESTDDLELRATLASRYEQQLRDSGQLTEADAFRGALMH